MDENTIEFEFGSEFLALWRQSHWAYPVHDEPWDFWRYSKETWKGLFNSHTGFEVVNAQYRYPAYIVQNKLTRGMRTLAARSAVLAARAWCDRDTVRSWTGMLGR